MAFHPLPDHLLQVFIDIFVYDDDTTFHSFKSEAFQFYCAHVIQFNPVITLQFLNQLKIPKTWTYHFVYNQDCWQVISVVEWLENDCSKPFRTQLDDKIISQIQSIIDLVNSCPWILNPGIGESEIPLIYSFGG